MVTMNAHDLMAKLAEQRQLFHSEADFQHALAWLLHEQWPDAKIRLEYPTAYEGQNRYLDIFVQNGDEVLAIELKYKTAKISVELDGEPFRLKNQSANDLGRQGFVRDIERMEQFLNGKNGAGWAILLTNDSGYWSPSPKQYPNDADYRLDEGRQLSGTLQWYDGDRNEMIYEGEEPTHLRGAYSINWRDYSQVSSPRYGVLRYLALEIKP